MVEYKVFRLQSSTSFIITGFLDQISFITLTHTCFVNLFVCLFVGLEPCDLQTIINKSHLPNQNRAKQLYKVFAPESPCLSARLSARLSVRLSARLSVQMSCKHNYSLTNRSWWKFYTVADYDLSLGMREDNPGVKYFKGDN